MATGNRSKKSPPSSKPGGSTAAPEKATNWAGVKRAFTTTHDSNRAIAKKFGTSHTMVAKRAAAEGWERPAKDESGKATAPRPIKAAEARLDRFVAEYLVDLNGTQAYLRAVPGTAEKTAQTMAARLLSKVEVRAAIQAGQEAMQERTKVTADRVVREIALIAFADARELTETRVGCCRHCWGPDFKRQRTQYQRDADFERWRLKAKPGEEFDEQGGTGFNPHLPPNPECIECCGDGHARDVIKDTRTLSPAAAALYAGVKRTKEGYQVLTQDKGAALDRLGKHLGIFEKDNAQRNDPLGVRAMTDAERAVRLNRLLSGDPALTGLLAQFLTAGEGA